MMPPCPGAHDAPMRGRTAHSPPHTHSAFTQRAGAQGCRTAGLPARPLTCRPAAAGSCAARPHRPPAASPAGRPRLPPPPPMAAGACPPGGGAHAAGGRGQVPQLRSALLRGGQPADGLVPRAELRRGGAVPHRQGAAGALRPAAPLPPPSFQCTPCCGLACADRAPPGRQPPQRPCRRGQHTVLSGMRRPSCSQRAIRGSHLPPSAPLGEVTSLPARHY